MNFENADIFSIDKSRYFVKCDIQNNKVFCKKSTIEEYNSLILAKQILSSYPNLQIDGYKYKVIVPNVYNYYDNIIDMQYFNGKNLELILRDNNTHFQGVNYLNNILAFLITKGFNWVDFAPKNILI